MEKNLETVCRRRLSWKIACKFWVFAKAYTGYVSRKKAFEEILEQECLWGVNGSAEDRFISKSELKRIWNQAVTIYPLFIDGHGITALSVEAGGETMMCDCTEPQKLLNNIVTILYC